MQNNNICMFVLHMEPCKSNQANSCHPFCSRWCRNVVGHVTGGCMGTQTEEENEKKVNNMTASVRIPPFGIFNFKGFKCYLEMITEKKPHLHWLYNTSVCCESNDMYRWNKRFLRDCHLRQRYLNGRISISLTAGNKCRKQQSKAANQNPLHKVVM